VFSRETAVTLRDTNLQDTVAVTGRTEPLAPGTHYVAMHCLSEDDGIRFDQGDLTVIAVAG
jgi:hypothetical protein